MDQEISDLFCSLSSKNNFILSDALLDVVSAIERNEFDSIKNNLNILTPFTKGFNGSRLPDSNARNVPLKM